MEALDRHGKPYPKPTRSAMDRAKAHRTIFQALMDVVKRNQGTHAYLSVIEGEARRHFYMLEAYRTRYGPNAHI